MELPSVKIFHSTSLKQKQVPIGYLFLIKPERIKIKSVFEYRLFNIMTFVRSIDVDVLGSLSSCFQFLRINFLWGKIKKNQWGCLQVRSEHVYRNIDQLSNKVVVLSL